MTVRVNEAPAVVDRLVMFSLEQGAAFGHETVRARHRLAELELFTDPLLHRLLETYPRDQLQAFTMGTDPLRREEWKPVDTTGATGRDLWEAVARGRLWLNIVSVHLIDRRFRELVGQLFSGIESQYPRFRLFRASATLLLSSPGTMVYYHADAQPNLLWHIRGSKRVWVYPAGDPALVSQELMEDIFASFADEEVPYRSEFDEKATTFDLQPGDVLAWPQNAPHRVTNLSGVNVSLSTPYETEASDRRKLTYCANRLLRRSYGIPVWATKETGPGASVKRFTYRVCRRLGMVETPPRRAYVTHLRIDPGAPTGTSVLSDGVVLTEFSRRSFAMKKAADGSVSVVPLPAGGASGTDGASSEKS